MTQLKGLSADFSTFLKSAATPAPKVEQGQAKKEEQVSAPVEPAGDGANRRLIQSAFNYVMSSLRESASTDSIGSAFMVAVVGLAKDAGIESHVLKEEAVAYLESIVESARESL